MGGAETSGEAVNKVGKYAYGKLGRKMQQFMMMLNSGKMMKIGKCNLGKY